MTLLDGMAGKLKGKIGLGKTCGVIDVVCMEGMGVATNGRGRL